MDQKDTHVEHSTEPASTDHNIDRLFWAGTLILTLGVRFYLFKNYYCVNNDGLSYIKAARDFWQGNWTDGLASFFPPLFPLMIASVYPLTGDWELAGQFWTLLLGVLVLLPLFGLLRRMYGSRVARVALIFYAVSPYIANLSLEVRTEVPYIFFAVSALYLSQRGLDSKSLLPFLLAGIISGLAYLLRPEGIGLVIVGVSFLFFRRWVLKRPDKSFSRTALWVLGFLLVSAPYISYLKWDTGQWSISRKSGVMLLVGIAKHDADAGAEVSVKRRLGHVSILDEIATRPVAYAKKVFVDVFWSVGYYIKALYPAYLPFLLIGWFFFFRERFWEKPDFFLMAFVVFYLAVFSLIAVTLRYGVPLGAVSLGWVGTGYLAVEGYLRKKWGKKGALVTGLLILILFAGTLPKTLQPVGREKYHLRKAGAYLKAKPGHPTILITSGQVAYYAEGQNQVFSAKALFGNSPALIDQDGDYLALDGESFGRFGVTIDTLKKRGWLLEKTFSSGSEKSVFIFRRLTVP